MFENQEEHLKGYIYDSLALRYQFARYKCMEVDIQDLISKGYKKSRAKEIAKGCYDRDFMRFIEILDEAIGEHD